MALQVLLKSNFKKLNLKNLAPLLISTHPTTSQFFEEISIIPGDEPLRFDDDEELELRLEDNEIEIVRTLYF